MEIMVPWADVWIRIDSSEEMKTKRKYNSFFKKNTFFPQV
jgi:hypothetical protein